MTGRLKGKIAVVTGASRGAGRGIAYALGEEGATVYVTGRSARGGTATDGRSETIEETAEGVAARGGTGIPVRCDHTEDAEIEALFSRVRKEQGRLDLLVNNAWGGYEGPIQAAWSNQFWKQPLRVWDGMFSAGVRSHMATTYFAAPLLLGQKSSLVILTTARMPKKYLGVMSYYIAKESIHRMAYCMAEELRSHNIAVIAIAPGWMRTEKVLDNLKTDEQRWQQVPQLKDSESTQYAGRAVVALAADPGVLKKSGRLFEAGELAREYGFTDIDGRQVPPFSEIHPELFKD